MKTLLGVPIVAVILSVVLMDTAQAGYCGAARISLLCHLLRYMRLCRLSSSSATR